MLTERSKEMVLGVHPPQKRVFDAAGSEIAVSNLLAQ